MSWWWYFSTRNSSSREPSEKPLIHLVLKLLEFLYLWPKTKSTNHHTSGYSCSTDKKIWMEPFLGLVSPFIAEWPRPVHHGLSVWNGQNVPNVPVTTYLFIRKAPSGFLDLLIIPITSRITHVGSDPTCLSAFALLCFKSCGLNGVNVFQCSQLQDIFRVEKTGSQKLKRNHPIWPAWPDY